MSSNTDHISKEEFFRILGVTTPVVTFRQILDIELRLHKDYANKLQENISIPEKEMCLYVWLVGYIASHWKACDEVIKKFGVSKVLSEIDTLKNSDSERCSQFGRILEEYLSSQETDTSKK